MTTDLFDLLRRHAIAYERCDHPAVFTTEEASRLVPPLPGAKAKNLLLRDALSGRLFLVLVPYEKRVDLSRLAALVGARKLAFAPADAMRAALGVTPGAVSVLALVNDTGHRVELLLDASIARAGAIQCHPLANTATLSIARDGLQRFLAATGHAPRVLDVPARAESG